MSTGPQSSLTILFEAPFGLPFVKIKNQDAAANSKVTGFRFFLDDFSHLSIQCALCVRIEKDVDVVSCVSDSHGQQSVRGAMFGQCDSFAHLRFSFYNVCSLSFGWVCDFFCSSAALLSFNFFSTDSFSGVLPPGAESCCLFSTMSIYLRIFFRAEMLDTPRFCRNRVRTLCLPWDALDWYSRNTAFIARRTVRADSLVVEIIMLNDLAHPRERRAWTARGSP